MKYRRTSANQKSCFCFVGSAAPRAQCHNNLVINHLDIPLCRCREVIRLNVFVLLYFAGDTCFHALMFKRLEKQEKKKQPSSSLLPLFFSLAEQKGSYSTLFKEKNDPMQ